MDFVTFLKIIFVAIVEGITEWLPISSTGHMIILENFFNISKDLGSAFWDLFLVIIQFGAILAVVFNFFKELWPFYKNKTKEEKKEVWRIWLNIFIACIPSIIVGLFLDDLMEKYFYNYLTVSITLIVYGIVFIILEYVFKKKNVQFKYTDVKSFSWKVALIIGLAQVLAIIPGTSRSGITIIAAMLIGCNRSSSMKFTFFLSIPVMIGASLLKTVKFVINGNSLDSNQAIYLLIGIVIAFLVSYLCIKVLTNFVKNHTFTGFGWYRITLGAVLLLLYMNQYFLVGVSNLLTEYFDFFYNIKLLRL